MEYGKYKSLALNTSARYGYQQTCIVRRLDTQEVFCSWLNKLRPCFASLQAKSFKICVLYTSQISNGVGDAVETGNQIIVSMERWLTTSYQKQQFADQKFCKIHRGTLVLEPLFNKFAMWSPAIIFNKQIPAQVFSYEFC